MKVSLVLPVRSACSLLFLFETGEYKEGFSIQESWCSGGVCARFPFFRGDGCCRRAARVGDARMNAKHETAAFAARAKGAAWPRT